MGNSKNTWEIYQRYSKKLPFWIINPENKPTLEAYSDYVYDQNIFSPIDNDLFRYDERSLDTLTIISKDPDIKYLILDMGSSTPIVSKPTLYEEFLYHVERVSFYAMGVWKIEFKRDYITLWIQFLQNIKFNRGIGDIRTLTTRTNLINDNYQFEDEKLKTLPLKISGWEVEELTPPSNIMTKEDMSNGDTSIVVDYRAMETKWRRHLGEGNFKKGLLTLNLPINWRGVERTSFCEYYVFNTEEYGMVFIPKVNFKFDNNIDGNLKRTRRIDIINGDSSEYYYIVAPYWIERSLVNKHWASQFLGVFLLPNWLTTSVLFNHIIVEVRDHNNDIIDRFERLLTISFGIHSNEIMSIDYQIPQKLKVDITKNNKLGVNNMLISNSIFQSLPSYLNYTNTQFNFQKHPDFFDWENNVMNFKHNFIFSGFGISTYYSKYEPMENWIKNLPNQLPSSTSKFAQYIQANQNVLQTGIWVKQEEAKINQATGIANALTGIAGAGISLFGMRNIMSKAKDALTKAYASSTGSLGTAHGGNQAIQGITNAIRAQNEVRFENARVRAKYADTFNSSTRQINYSQAIDALSKEFTEGRICDIVIYPLIDNLDVFNDTIVRYGNKTYEFFRLDDLITVKEGKKFNYFEVNSENFLKETNNYPIIWEHFTYEDISTILDWLEEGIRLWNTKDVEYEYQE